MLNRIKQKVKNIIQSIVISHITSNAISEEIAQKLMLQNGKIFQELKSKKNEIKSLEEVEFKVFSQWGDDGIIQYLINKVEISNKTFIEFGVEDYLESNTRFLLMNNNWSGLVMDGSETHINKIKKSDTYWKFDLIAKKAFITAENINDLISEEGIYGEIGLLHIDIDGNDYWVWKALQVVEPIIMIVEYNSVFGQNRPITIPYKANFNRSEAHSSNIFAGSSILSLYDLAQERGYAFIGCNSAGNNAYFVKKGHLNGMNSLTVNEGYVESKFREARNDEGELIFTRGNERINLILGMEVFNTRTNKLEKI